MTPEDRQRAIEEYRAELLRDVAKLHEQRKMIRRTDEFIDDELESLMNIASQFSFDSLPIADSPPLLVAIMRAELARALHHTRRAGKCAKRLNLPLEHYAAALQSLKAAAAAMPTDLPRTRRLPR